MLLSLKAVPFVMLRGELQHSAVLSDNLRGGGTEALIGTLTLPASAACVWLFLFLKKGKQDISPAWRVQRAKENSSSVHLKHVQTV